MIKIFIIDDSMLTRNFIKKVLKNQENIEIIAEASNPIEALEKIVEVGLPDVFILDLEMPQMDGLEFLEKLKNERPVPTIIFASLENDKSEKALKALELGAIDIVVKPLDFRNLNIEEFTNDFLNKIKAASGSKNNIFQKEKEINTTNKVIAIGASTGGVQTLELILTKLKPNHAPILITMHMPEGFTASFAKRLDKFCLNSIVKEAKNNELINSGMIFIAPGDLHLEIEKINNKYFTSLKDYPKVSNHKPSVDVLFRSFAKNVKENSIAFILTGMGKDGAIGISEIKDTGGLTYGQDEETSIVYGMPKVAFEMGAIDSQVSITQIIDIINTIR